MFLSGVGVYSFIYLVRAALLLPRFFLCRFLLLLIRLRYPHPQVVRVLRLLDKIIEVADEGVYGCYVLGYGGEDGGGVGLVGQLLVEAVGGGTGLVALGGGGHLGGALLVEGDVVLVGTGDEFEGVGEVEVGNGGDELIVVEVEDEAVDLRGLLLEGAFLDAVVGFEDGQQGGVGFGLGERAAA